MRIHQVLNTFVSLVLSSSSQITNPTNHYQNITIVIDRKKQKKSLKNYTTKEKGKERHQMLSPYDICLVLFSSSPPCPRCVMT